MPDDISRVLYDGTVFADYHQFTIEDSAHPFGVDDVPAFTDDEIAARLIEHARKATVSTVRNWDVRLEILLHPRKPDVDLAPYDHAVEGGFGTHGEIRVIGCTMPPLDLASSTVPAGHLRCLLLAYGLGGYQGTDGTDEAGELQSGEGYVVHLWPADEKPLRVLKPWTEPGGGGQAR